MNVAKTILLGALLAVMSPTSATADPKAHALPGEYRAEDGSHAIRLFRCTTMAEQKQRPAKRLCGKITWVREVGTKDVHNPNPKLRSRPLVGLVHLRGLRHEGSRWVDGRLYNPEDGDAYRAELWRDDDRLIIEGRPDVPVLGSLLGRLFGRITYVRTDDGKQP